MGLTDRTKGQGSPIRGESDTGAAAVEMALVLPMLVLLLAGIMDYGLLLNDQMAMRQGVGAAVRQGVVGQAGSSDSCPIAGAAAANAQTRKLICLTKQATSVDSGSSRVMISFPGTQLKGGSLIMCVQYPMESTTTIFDPLMDGVLKAKVEMRIEQDLSGFTSAAETALPGGDWTWCV